jgi:hypothetical protein
MQKRRTVVITQEWDGARLVRETREVTDASEDAAPDERPVRGFHMEQKKKPAHRSRRSPERS